MSSKELLQKVIDALRSFLAKDKQLLRLDASERSISHKLAEYLQQEFPEWNVDCEYNRRGDRPKTMPRSLFHDILDNDQDAKTIFPDIIVHRRNRADNLLVLEIKKSNSNVSFESDKIKLKAFTDREGDYNYKVGLFIEFDIDNQKISSLRCFEGGQEVPLDTSLEAKLEALGHG